MLNNLAISLADIGKRETALRSVEELVAIYRKLAEARPDAFIPDLAMSLANLVYHLTALDRYEEAVSLSTEAITIIAPFYQRYPEAFADLSGKICYRYRKCCEALRQEPDASLLAPFADLAP